MQVSVLVLNYPLFKVLTYRHEISIGQHYMFALPTDSNRSELRNENGILVPSLNISDFFAIDANTGELEVVTENLDRELIQDFKIVIMVEDVKADIVASQFRHAFTENNANNPGNLVLFEPKLALLIALQRESIWKRSWVLDIHSIPGC